MSKKRKITLPDSKQEEGVYLKEDINLWDLVCFLYTQLTKKACFCLGAHCAYFLSCRGLYGEKKCMKVWICPQYTFDY